MPNMQIAVRLRGETGFDFLYPSFFQVLINEVLNKILGLRLCILILFRNRTILLSHLFLLVSNTDCLSLKSANKATYLLIKVLYHKEE